MYLTLEQMAFLSDLRGGARRATAAQDASMIGPLIRANLVRWDDDPREGARRRHQAASSFTLTVLGEASLARYDTPDHPAG
jgi:hypothetical protein